MGLKEVLEKMKLVELEEAEALAPPQPPPRAGGSVSPPAPPRRPGAPPPPPPGRRNLDEVVKTAAPPKPLDEASLPAGAGLGDIPDFAAIYKASGVTPPAHGFSAEKVLEILSAPEFEPLDARAKAAALMGFLKMNPAGPVPLADVIQDAVQRDQALDGFEAFLTKKLEQRQGQLDQENQALQREIDEVTRRNQEKMGQNAKALEAERERLATWQARKRIEERRLFDAVAPFVEENPVSLGSGPAKPQA